MKPTTTCPRCGRTLQPDAPEGLCSACLLGAAAAEPMTQNFVPHSDAPGRFVPPKPKDLEKHFPQLEILDLIGHGGMGAVYKVRQKQLDRVVALKIVHPHAARDPAFAERFAREARALARLNHPNIVTVHEFGQIGDLCFLIMELVDGASLRQLMSAGELTPAQALAIVPPICEALQYAHDQGVVHRDIKPENVLLTQSGRVKLADFGLAKVLGNAADMTLTGTHQVMGTPRYMSPEQIERPTQVDHRADIYSLGVVLYEMLTGELPIGRFQLPSQKVRVDVRLDEVVLRSLEKEPARRYQRAGEMKTAVEHCSGASFTPDKPVKEPDGKEAEDENALSWPGLVTLAFVLLGVLSFIAGSGSFEILPRKLANFLGIAFMISSWFAGAACKAFSRQ